MTRTTHTARASFKGVYQLCRLNRGNIHFDGQFFHFQGGGTIYLTGSDLVLGRKGRMLSSQPAWRATELNLYRDKASRREVIEACRKAARIPLP